MKSSFIHNKYVIVMKKTNKVENIESLKKFFTKNKKKNNKKIQNEYFVLIRIALMYGLLCRSQHCKRQTHLDEGQLEGEQADLW